MGAGHQKDQLMIRSLKFSALPPILQRGERDKNRVNNQACLWDEASTKIPNVQGLESFWGEHMEVPGEWGPEKIVP